MIVPGRAPPPIAELPPLRLRRCRHGLMLFPAADIYIGRSLDLYGEYSESEASLLCRVVEPGQTALDIGANIGTLTLPLARRLGARGRLIAVEPHPALSQLLRTNLAINQLDHAEIVAAAMGAAPGRMTAPALDFGQKGNFGQVELRPFDGGGQIETRTVDGLDLPSCQLIKIDVEGMELDVLNGAAATIARHRPLLYVENDRRARSPALIDALLSLDYRLFWDRPPLYNRDNFYGVGDNVFGTIASRNMFCFPREQERRVIGGIEATSPEAWI